MPLQPKRIPPASLSLVTDPASDTEYVHFESSIDVPFDPGAQAFSVVNAWWLTDCALLTYWPEAEARARFRGNGRFDDAVLIDRSGTQCYVAWTSAVVVAAFRGTQPNERIDILRDLNFPKAGWDRPGERVHRGFKEGLDVAFDLVLAEIARHPGRSVWFAGHSLGAAITTLAADRYLLRTGVQPSLYAVASPRVGDAAFVDGMAARLGGRTFRDVNNADIVTRLPPALFGFGEIATVRRFGKDPSDPAIIPDPLIDHTPRRYAVLAWNAVVKAFV